MTSTRRSGRATFTSVCLALSRIANFDDLDPLKQEPGVRLTMLGPGRAIPGDADLVILPGTKSTRGDLAFLRAQDWDIDLRAHVRRGGHVLGICGGYQMLGRMVDDPEGIEGAPGATEGLGFLQVETVMTPEKRLTEVDAVHAATGRAFHGYEIHIGRTEGPDRRTALRPSGRRAGRGGGCHGPGAGQLPSWHVPRRRFSRRVARRVRRGRDRAVLRRGASRPRSTRSRRHMEAHLDVAGLLAIAR